MSRSFGFQGTWRACDPLTPLLQHSRPESELIFLKNLKKFGEAKNIAQKSGSQADTLVCKGRTKGTS